MDKLLTEKATSHWDLPHGYTPTGTANAECTCHRSELDPIHSSSLPAEHASFGDLIQTEKGT